MSKFCSIPSCRNHFTLNRNIKFFPLPSDEARKATWAKAFGLSQSDMNNADTRICSSHFRHKLEIDNKNEATHFVNGSGGGIVFMNNQPETTMLNAALTQPLLPNQRPLLPTFVSTNSNNMGTSLNNGPFVMAFPDNPEIGSYIIQIPDVNNSSNVQLLQNVVQNIPVSQYQQLPNSVQTVQKPIQTAQHTIQFQPIPNTVQTVQNPLQTAQHSIQLVRTPLQSVPSSATLGQSYVEQTPLNIYTSVESCELFCQEESLTPEQENFHRNEWLKHVKFTASVQNLPSISVSDGSEIKDKIPGGNSMQDAPVLIYSNAPPKIPSTLNSSPKSPLVMAPAQYQLTTTGLTTVNTVSSPVSTSSAISDTPAAPHVFPVKLERTNLNVTTENPESKEEEIFPKILQDKETVSLFNKIKEATLSPKPYATYLKRIRVTNEDSNETETASSPALSNLSSGNECLSPDLLNNLEVNIEENETESLPAVEDHTNPSTFLGSEAENAADTDGPKIVDVICGVAGANEFFQSSVQTAYSISNEAKSFLEMDIPSDKSDAAPLNSLPKLVTQNSIFSMQKTIAVIASGHVEATVRNLLGVRLHIPPTPSVRDIPTQLKNRLRKENFLTICPWWMVKKMYLPLNPPCSNCGKKMFKINSCYEYLDGLCWICINRKCRKIYPVKRPKFFERFPSFSLEELLLLTYHWACKSRIWVINYDVPVHADRIWSYFCALQELCGRSVARNCSFGKNTKKDTIVEVSAVKLGNFFVLCAFDRRNKVSRLQALTTEEACTSVKHIRVLEEWLGDKCTLITWKKISDEFLPNVTKVSADPNIDLIADPGSHILNASKYLGKTMVQMFQNISHDQLTIDIVQGVLNEVQWRERHGVTEEEAFWNIMDEIAQLNDSCEDTEVLQGDIAKDRFYYKADMSFKLRWGPIENEDKAAAPASRIAQAGQSRFAASKLTSASATSSSRNTSPAEPIIYRRAHPISIASVPVVRTGNERAPMDSSITPRDFLSIKIFFDYALLQKYKVEAEKLGVKLNKEGYLSNPVRWLVSKQYIKDESPCYVCHGKSLLMDNPKQPDGVSWYCQKSNCKFENKYKRPDFFAYFGFKLEVICAIVYHWAVQTEYNILMKSVPLYEYSILSVHRKLQAICAKAIQSFKLGGKNILVEVAFVRFANCFILGSMERAAKYSRFRTFSSENKLHIDEIRKTLISWLWPKSTVIVNSNKYLGQYSLEDEINLAFADQTITDVNSDKYHTLTITHYLQNHLKVMFRTLKVQHISADLLQVYLDELVWRERYGKTSVEAFNSIMKCIFATENGVSFDEMSRSIKSEKDIIKYAALSYGFTLPLPKVEVVLKKLTKEEIKSYTSPVVQEAKVVDNFVPIKKIKEEVVSDEEIDVVNIVDTDKLLNTLYSSASSSPSPSSSSSSSSSQSSFSSTSTASDSSVSKSSSFSIKSAEQKGIISKTAEQKSVVSKTAEQKSVVSKSPDQTSVVLKSPDQTSVVLKSPFTQFSVKKPSFNLNVPKSSFNKRYSDKCYTHKRKGVSLGDGTSLCVECKDLVSKDHYVKLYTCSDCKHIVYTTYCQKAFARHRSFVLFGRKVSDRNSYSSSIILPQLWYCLCGYSTTEGNKLAFHLVQCGKRTCYLKLDDTHMEIL